MGPILTLGIPSITYKKYCYVYAKYQNEINYCLLLIACFEVYFWALIWGF